MYSNKTKQANKPAMSKNKHRGWAGKGARSKYQVNKKINNAIKLYNMSENIA